jgi:hypothetical protein
MFTELAHLARERLELKKSDPLDEIVERVLSNSYTKFDELDESLMHRKSGRCVMSFIDGQGRFRCSINALCERLNVPVIRYKADPCFLFPLHYGQFDVNHYLLSVLSEESRAWIGQDKAVSKLRCLRVPEPGSPPAYVSLRAEIEHALGPEFYSELAARSAEILARHHSLAALNSGTETNGIAK